MEDLQELTPELYLDMMKEIFEDGEQNRFRNNDYRSFEEWVEDKEE